MIGRSTHGLQRRKTWIMVHHIQNCLCLLKNSTLPKFVVAVQPGSKSLPAVGCTFRRQCPSPSQCEGLAPA